MIPLPPLDGGRVLVGLLPRPLAVRLAQTERFGMLILIGLLFVLPMMGRELNFDLNVLSWLLLRPLEFLYNAVVWITGIGYKLLIMGLN
jgi:Zn-dependent protease